MTMDEICNFLNKIKKLTVHFQYHLKCQDITDKEGDIKLDLMESSQNNEFSFHVINSMTIDYI